MSDVTQASLDNPFLCVFSSDPDIDMLQLLYIFMYLQTPLMKFFGGNVLMIVEDNRPFSLVQRPP